MNTLIPTLMGLAVLFVIYLLVSRVCRFLYSCWIEAGSNFFCEELGGTVKLLRVIDGDTFQISCPTAPPTLGVVSIRLRGCDAPEMGKPGGEEATRFLTDLLGQANRVLIKEVRKDKYGGRFVADVFVGGKSIAHTLIFFGHAVEYDGGRRA